MYNQLKKYIIILLFIIKIPQIYFHIKNIFFKNHIKIINYHNFYENDLINFEKQINFILKYYEICNYKKFKDFFYNTKNVYTKPLIIFSFDDGLVSHYKFVAPILKKYGITGWFFIPTKFIESDLDKENLKNNFNGAIESLFPKKLIKTINRDFMNWDEVNNLLYENHVIGSHTHDHIRLLDNLPIKIINDQIILSKNIIESKTKVKLSLFCWVGGEEYSYGESTYKTIIQNYEYAFSTNFKNIYKNNNKYMLDRTNIEADYSWPFFIFYFSGIMDLFYFFKRRRLKIKLKDNNFD